MAEIANKTYQSLRDLMDLKQRQANVSEAGMSRAQVEVSARHWRLIMLLIINTIIFPQMSVLATIVGMNVKLLDSGTTLELEIFSYLVSGLFCYCDHCPHLGLQ